MRIEKIRIENLNSLYGVHEIDFTHEAFRNNNLFLLRGDTGSGKSTVLDAITLALYGRTPRLNRINLSGNEIMSKGTDRCSAEVTFTIDDKRYRARWAQQFKVIQRGTCKGQRSLDDYTVEFCAIQENGEGIPFSGTKTAVQDEIERVLKLSYPNFTKAVLLAQGNFEQFLDAPQEQKAVILEALTDTQIYSSLSQKAHSVCGEKEKEYHHLKEQEAKDGADLLTKEQIEEGRLREIERRREVEALKGELESLDRGLQWLSSVQKARDAVDRLHAEKEEYSRECEEFAPKQALLEAGVRASKIVPFFDLRNKARDGLKNAEDALRSKEEALPQAEAAEAQARSNVQNAEDALRRAKDELDKAEPVFLKVRELQTKMRAQTEQRDSLEKAQKDIADERKSLEEEIARAQDEVANKQGRLNKAATGYFVEHAVDVQIREELGGIRANGEKVKRSFESLQNATTVCKDADKKLAQAHEDVKKSESRVQDRKGDLDARKAEHAKTLENYERICDGHAPDDLDKYLSKLRENRILRMQIAKYEDVRRTLRDGDACPCCGSLHHPFCVGQVPQVSELDAEIAIYQNRIDAIKAAKSALDVAEKAEAGAQNELEKVQIALDALRKTLAEQENAVAEKNDAWERARGDYAKAVGDFEQSVKKYAVSAEISSIDAVVKELEKRKETWDKCVAARDNLQEELHAAQKRIDEKTPLWEKTKRDAAKKQSEIDLQNEEIAKTYAEIVAILGDRNVDAEEKRLKAARDDAEERHKSAQAKLVDMQTKVAGIRSAITPCREYVQTRNRELAVAEENLWGALQTAQFADEAGFVQARMASEDLDALVNRSEALKKKGSDLETRLREATREFEKLQEQAVTEGSAEELRAERQEKLLRRDAMLSESGKWASQLEQNEKKVGQVRELKEKIVLAEREMQRWKALNELIGHNKGTTYRNFAQGLTFNLLLRNANRYLHDLMNRYELVRQNSEDQSLEFCLYDYQTGEMRPSKNLSGGEKFCLSLALALALSEMASQNVTIDSLFIDEGLGTLDDGTLDTALMMLENLGGSQRNRMVGLVTHVSRARDSISTQIVVERLGNGQSRLMGPGCGSRR